MIHMSPNCKEKLQLPIIVDMNSEFHSQKTW